MATNLIDGMIVPQFIIVTQLGTKLFDFNPVSLLGEETNYLRRDLLGLVVERHQVRVGDSPFKHFIL